MARRHYSDEERADAMAALQANEGNVSGTAKQMGIPESTLRSWAAEPDRAAPAKLREEKKESLAELFEEWARHAIGYGLRWFEANAGEDPDGHIAVKIMTGAGIATDKLLALRNEQPTQRHELSGHDGEPIEIRGAGNEEERTARILELMRKHARDGDSDEN